jgi:hypothetical protein
MKISKNFVIGLLSLLVADIVANLLSFGFGIWNQWIGWSFVAILVVLFLLIFRKHKVGFIRFLAWTLPILFILTVLYLNFLPFGFHKDYSITIGADGSVVSSSSQIYLQDMKGKMITNLSDVYTYGQVNVIVKPKAVLRNATVNISIINSNSSNVYLAKTNFSVENNNWDYFWDFTKGIPSPLTGTAKYDKEKGCVYFNGSLNQTLSYPNSSDMFEDGSFVVYAKWRPEDAQGKAQQIIGHYNWELWQNNDSLRFMIGRLDNKTGSMPSISFPVNESFFDETHEAIAVYKSDKGGFGYMEFYVDNQFVGRKTISNSSIWAEYNGNKDLNMGWSPHNYGNNSYFTGCIYSGRFDYENISHLTVYSFDSSNKTIQIPVLGNGMPQEIKLTVDQ